MFRIAIGSCSCSGKGKKSGVDKVACNQIALQFEQIKDFSYPEIAGLPSYETRNVNRDGYNMSITRFVENKKDRVLIVAQVFHPTWIRPNYLSFSRIGRIYAEGYIVTADRKWRPAPDDMLWAFR